MGLGGERGATAASGKLGANGRLVTLKTLLDFVKSALSQDSAEDVFSGWLEDSQDRGKGKGKGKAVMVSREAIMFEGSLVPLTAWGLERNDGAWDLNQLANGSLENEEGTQDALTVSLRRLDLVFAYIAGSLPPARSTLAINLPRICPDRLLPVFGSSIYARVTDGTLPDLRIPYTRACSRATQGQTQH